MEVRGFFPEEVRGVGELVERMEAIGFQATEVSRAAELLREMVEDEDLTLYLGFTSNIISSGLREVVAYIVKEGWVDVVVTTVGGVEEDVMKSLGSFEIGDWFVDDAELKRRGINRIGNIFVRTELYEKLEKFLVPIFEELYASGKKTVSPVELNRVLGKKLRDERSFLYWAARRDVPVVCPAPTDGALGLILFYYRENNRKDFGIDVTGDMELLANITFEAKRTGALIVGGGVPKHHIIGMNLVRGGLDKAVYITTAVEWDGSLSGARPREAKSWGKIKTKANTAYVYSDATIVLPLIVKAVSEWIR